MNTLTQVVGRAAVLGTCCAHTQPHGMMYDIWR